MISKCIYCLVILQSFSITLESDSSCDEKFCSSVIDYVCARSKGWDGNIVISKHTNACHLQKVACWLKEYAEVTQVPLTECNERKLENTLTRRVQDHGIVGAYQVCNHSCPTYCVDTYEPACAVIWDRKMAKSKRRVMINHCHIDLLSCALGVNVTIAPLGKCYPSALGIVFMSQIAALKSMGLLESEPQKHRRDMTRRQGTDDFEKDSSKVEFENVLRQLITKNLWDILRVYRQNK